MLNETKTAQTHTMINFDIEKNNIDPIANQIDQNIEDTNRLIIHRNNVFTIFEAFGRHYMDRDNLKFIMPIDHVTGIPVTIQEVSKHYEPFIQCYNNSKDLNSQNLNETISHLKTLMQPFAKFNKEGYASLNDLPPLDLAYYINMNKHKLILEFTEQGFLELGYLDNEIEKTSPLQKKEKRKLIVDLKRLKKKFTISE